MWYKVFISILIYTYCCMVFENCYQLFLAAITVITGRVFDTEYDSVSFLCWKDSTIAMKFSLFITYTEGRKTFKMLKFKNKNHEQPVCIPFVIT